MPPERPPLKAKRKKRRFKSLMAQITAPTKTDAEKKEEQARKVAAACGGGTFQKVAEI